MVVALSVLQAVMGAMLVYLLLRTPQCDRFIHRFLAFALAVVGNLSLVTAIIYYTNFCFMRSFATILLLTAIFTLLHYHRWKISELCDHLTDILKKVSNGSSS